MQLNVAKQELESLKVNFGEIHKIRCEILAWFQVKISDCRDCSKFGENLSENWHIGSGDQSSGDERIKELELELAQTKLAHVEAECRNQVRIFLIGFVIYSKQSLLQFIFFPVGENYIIVIPLFDSFQNLTHQLRSTEQELTTAKNTWPPWMSKALSSIKEVSRS